MVTDLEVHERLYYFRIENNVQVSVTAQLISVFVYACLKVRSFLRGSFIERRRHVVNLMKTFYSFKMNCHLWIQIRIILSFNSLWDY